MHHNSDQVKPGPASSLCKQSYFPQVGVGVTACPARASGIEILRDRIVADKTAMWNSNSKVES